MANYALPLQENTSQGGFGVLPKGSRIHIENAKIIRAFTYWEKVNDIDLSVFGIDAKGRQTEFSWRTMAGRKPDAIFFSGESVKFDSNNTKIDSVVSGHEYKGLSIKPSDESGFFTKGSVSIASLTVWYSC